MAALPKLGLQGKLSWKGSSGEKSRMKAGSGALQLYKGESGHGEGLAEPCGKEMAEGGKGQEGD